MGRRALRTCAAALVAAAGLAVGAAAAPSALVQVDGLTCPFCAYGIEKRIRAVPGVEGLTIRMRVGEVEVRYAVGARPDAPSLRRAVEEAGFTPRAVEIRTEAPPPAPAPRPIAVDASWSRWTGLAGPVGAAVGENGEVYVSEAEANRIVARAPGGETHLVASLLDRPMHMALASGRLYVAEFGAGRVAVLDPATGERLGGIGDSATLDAPAGIAVSPSGRIYVADFYRHRIAVFDETGTLVAQVGQKGHDTADLFYPTDVALDAHGTLYVADAYNHRVQVYSPQGRFLRSLGGADEFRVVEGIDVAPSGDVFIADAENGRVWGDGRREWGDLDYPVDVVVLPDGGALVVLNHLGEVRRLAPPEPL